MSGAEDVARALAEEFRGLCHEQRKAWGSGEDPGNMADLWLARAEGMSAFLDWLDWKDESS